MTTSDYTPPTKRVAAGALFLNETGEILLVNPTYKPQWEIPGGLVEENEPPREGCIREVREEIGLAIEPHRLLSLDYRPAPRGGHRPDMLRFVFWGGRLTEEQIAAIRLDTKELSELCCCTLAEAQQRLSPSLGEVVAACLELLESERTQYVEFVR